MLKVFKYEVPVQDSFSLKLPPYAKIIAFQAQHEKPRIWALVDPDEDNLVTREFRLAGTGHPIDVNRDSLVYIDTCQLFGGDLVLHLFEVVEL